MVMISVLYLENPLLFQIAGVHQSPFVVYLYQSKEGHGNGIALNCRAERTQLLNGSIVRMKSCASDRGR